MEDSGDSTEAPVEDSAKGIIKAVAPYTCEQCGRAFRRRSNLSRHQRLHSGERPFECPQCHRPFAHRSSLRHHLRLHTGERPYQCSVCLRTFRQRPNYSLHLKTHTGEKRFRCVTCGKEFAQRVHLTTHSRLHSGELPYACQDCGRRFSQQCHLTRHRGTRGEEREHLCHLCGGKFLSHTCLSSHLKTHDVGTHPKAQKQRRSQKRQQDTEGVSELRSRVQGVSVTKGRVRAKVECEVCHKTFHKASHLRHHRYTHTGERPYPCPQCGRRFSEAGSLRRHMTSHIRAHLKHSHSRSTPTTRTPNTPMYEDSNVKPHHEIQGGFGISKQTHDRSIPPPHASMYENSNFRPHQEVQEGGFGNSPASSGVLQGTGVESWATTTLSSPSHYHSTETTEAVCMVDNAVCTTSNNCLSLSATMPESKDCFEKSSSECEVHLRPPLTSQSTPLPSLIKQTTTEKQACDPHSSLIKQTETEKQIHDPALPPHSDLHSQSQTKINDSCDGGKDIPGCTKLMDDLGKEEGRIDYANKPYVSPHTPKTLVAMSLFLFGKRVKEEAEMEEENVKEELELIEEAV